MQRLPDDLAPQQYIFLSGLDKSYSSLTRAYVLRHHMVERRKRARHNTGNGTTSYTLARTNIFSGEEKGTEYVSTLPGPMTSVEPVVSTKGACAGTLPVANRSPYHLELGEAEEKVEPLLYYPYASGLLAQGRVDPFSTFARPLNHRENLLIDYCKWHCLC